MEKLTRLASGTIKFIPQNETEEIVLGFNQNANLNRQSETKELLSNDESLGQSVAEIETKVTYEFSTEIGDLNLNNLALAFKGLIVEKTYKAGDKFWNSKTILDGTKLVTADIGDMVINAGNIYTLTAKAAATNFVDLKTAPKVYKATIKQINPENRTNNIGTIIVEGKNLVTSNPQILIIPKVNLKFEGDLGIIADDFIKLSLKGKILKAAQQELFYLIDGEMA